MEDTGCYACIHHSVCKHFGKWDERFPFKDDGKIGPYINGLSKVLSDACAYYLTTALTGQPDKPSAS